MKPLLAFVHIEKTAGTTLHLSFAKALFPYYLASPTRADQRGISHGYLNPTVLKRILYLVPWTKMVGGHSIRSYAGYDNYLDRDILYVTFLREPAHRYVSHYLYQYEVMGLQRSFEEYLAIEEFSDLMCQRICGERNSAKAIEEVHSHFFFVGLLEHLAQSLRLLERLLHGRHIEVTLRIYQARNTRKDRVGLRKNRVLAPEIPAKYRDDILNRNKNDQALYQYVKTELFTPAVNSCYTEKGEKIIIDSLSQDGKLDAALFKLLRLTVYRPLEYLSGIPK